MKTLLVVLLFFLAAYAASAQSLPEQIYGDTLAVLVRHIDNIPIDNGVAATVDFETYEKAAEYVESFLKQRRWRKAVESGTRGVWTYCLSPSIVVLLVLDSEDPTWKWEVKWLVIGVDPTPEWLRN